MSLQLIRKPYRIFVPEAAVKTGRFNEVETFGSKKKAQAFVKRVREVVPDFNPILRVFFRYEDSISGKLYTNRLEYDREQERVREWRKQQEAERKI